LEVNGLLSTVLTGWYIGFAIAIVVIGIVVILVASILVLARRIGEQAMAIEESLDTGRGRTLALWDVANVNEQLNQIVRRAATARSVLENR
jgi:ABC-type multidrug transport system fused ATPase/permease subunit